MLNSKTLKTRIIQEIGKSKSGLSAWDLEKKIGRNVVTFQRINNYLNAFIQMGILQKVGSKYVVSTPLIINNGTIISADPPIIIDCPYFNDNCNCGEKLRKNCRYINELPKPISDFFKNII